MCLFRRSPAPLLLFSVLALVPKAALSQVPSPRQPSGIRVTVDRVSVGVIVTDARGQFVTGLRREDFYVLDNGTEQPITDFLSTDEPAQVLLLVETGPAVYLLQGGHLRAVFTLLEGLSANDRVAIAGYDESPKPILDFTADKNAAAAALDQLRFNLGVGQLNLASSVALALDWLARVPGKKSLVLLSTGVDTSPAIASENLLSRLKTTDVRVLAVSLGAELRSARPADKKRVKKDQVSPDKSQAAAEGFAQADEQLRALAVATGGRVYFPASPNDFRATFAEIAQLLRHEYDLAFTPPARDAKLHTIEIHVALRSNSADSSVLPPAFHVDHRRAYLAPEPSPN